LADRQHNKKRNKGDAGEKVVSFGQLGLSPAVIDALAQMGHTTPTPVQAQAIPPVLAGRDVLAAAQTGTGKTEAFLLPTLSNLGHAAAGEGPLMLVITPTRELAQQIDDVASTICSHTGHRTVTLVGGVAYEPQYQALERGCDVLVATPGRLQDLIDSGHASLSQVEVLVLDEADRMLDMGFLPAVRKIVAKTPASRQTLLFSATLDDDALASTRSLVRDPVRIEIARKGTPAETVDQYVLAVSPEAKNAVLAEVLRREGPRHVIVFTRGKHRADAICRKLRKAGIACAPIHGNRSQRQRENALRNFREGEVDVLVATDVLARGIDIPDVRYVINFDVPGDAEDYIHRIGRTGRAGETGWALTFVTEDDYLELRDAEALMGKVVPAYPRAEGLDLGEKPVRLDPDRDPHEKLPGKKARKKMAEERKARRERERAEREGEQAKGGARPKAEAPARRKAKARRDDDPSRKAKRPARKRAHGEGKPKAAEKAGGHSTAGKAASRRRSKAMPYGPAGKPKRETAKRLSRHPGDRGGRR
jgi:ATP-dependent RNA helicase RhlE